MLVQQKGLNGPVGDRVRTWSRDNIKKRLAHLLGRLQPMTDPKLAPASLGVQKEVKENGTNTARFAFEVSSGSPAAPPQGCHLGELGKPRCSRLV
jgi:hypothetical protein